MWKIWNWVTYPFRWLADLFWPVEFNTIGEPSIDETIEKIDAGLRDEVARVGGFSADYICIDEADIINSDEFKALPKVTRDQAYKKMGKSPSGFVDGVYNDANRINPSYNDIDQWNQ